MWFVSQSIVKLRKKKLRLEKMLILFHIIFFPYGKCYQMPEFISILIVWGVGEFKNSLPKFKNFKKSS